MPNANATKHLGPPTAQRTALMRSRAKKWPTILPCLLFCINLARVGRVWWVLVEGIRTDPDRWIEAARGKTMCAFHKKSVTVVWKSGGGGDTLLHFKGFVQCSFPQTVTEDNSNSLCEPSNNTCACRKVKFQRSWVWLDLWWRPFALHVSFDSKNKFVGYTSSK